MHGVYRVKYEMGLIKMVDLSKYHIRLNKLHIYVFVLFMKTIETVNELKTVQLENNLGFNSKVVIT